jgi:hypothetical protein
MKISPQTLAFIQRIAAKLNEKSSVYGYAMIFAGLFASKYQNDFAIAAGITSATAGIVLWFLSDTQVRALLTGQPAELPKPSVPPSQDK